MGTILPKWDQDCPLQAWGQPGGCSTPSSDRRGTLSCSLLKTAVCLSVATTTNRTQSLGRLSPSHIPERGEPGIHLESDREAGGGRWGKEGGLGEPPLPLSLLTGHPQPSWRPHLSSPGFYPSSSNLIQQMHSELLLDGSALLGAEKNFFFFSFISSAWLDTRDMWPYFRHLCFQAKKFHFLNSAEAILPGDSHGRLKAQK